MTLTVAVIAMGEMGAGVAGRLVERGARVLTSLQGRSSASAARAAEAGVEVVGDDEALVSVADVVLSIVPPARAGELAGRLLPALRRANPRPLYADCNAVAPATVRAIAEGFAREALPFVDAGIIGGPPTRQGYNPRIYASGEAGERLAALNDYGLDIRPLGGAIGDASALKMAYAGTTKGTSAVMVCLMLGAMRAGVADAFVAEMADSQSGRLEGQVRQLPSILKKAYRWDGEMEEIAKFLAPEEGASQIFRGAAELYRELAKDFAEGPDAERMALLESLAERVR
jgi:3-hydroxyisobutyrate dehydrogenase-like beta-hydroxyacid dehydrogenase